MSTVTIPLTQGKVALVEEADLPLLSDYKWHVARRKHTCYAGRWGYTEDGRVTILLMHRIVMDAPPARKVDHINHDGLDNRRCNLRVVSNEQNAWNLRKHSDGRSGFKGVTWDASRDKWLAQINRDKRHYNLGRFADVLDAAKAYDAAARSLHGEYAVLNFP